MALRHYAGRHEAGFRASAIAAVQAATWLAGRAIRLVIRAYQLVLSPLIGPGCRYLPSCSEYAMEAVGLHGPVRGSWLALRRIARCHPLGGSGLDPVPPIAVSATSHAATGACHHRHCT